MRNQAHQRRVDGASHTRAAPAPAAATSVGGRVIQNALRPEIDLLLLCARTSVPEAIADKIRSLAAGAVDWTYLEQLANRHGLLPLLFRNLTATCPGGVPPAIMARLRDRYQEIAWRNLHMTQELLRLLALFEAQGVEALGYKGPVLAVAVYGNLALRLFGDLDILVRPRDVARAREIMIEEGYTPGYTFSHEQQVAFLRNRHELEMAHTARKVAVELHWAFAEPWFGTHIRAEDVWNRLGKMALAGTTVRTLAAEDLLIVLCLHGSKHLWERLEWLCGVAELVGREQFHWPAVMRRAEKLHLRRRMLLSLLLANDLLALPLPQEVLRRAREDKMVRRMVEQVRLRLFSEPSRQGTAERMGPQTRFYLRMQDSFGDRIRFGLRLALSLSSKDYELIDLPPQLLWLHYAIRPFRVLYSYGRRWISR